jgi:methyl-accepting chemotaxis protein
MRNLGLKRLMVIFIAVVALAMIATIFGMKVANDRVDQVMDAEGLALLQIREAVSAQNRFLGDFSSFIDDYGLALAAFRNEAFSLVELAMSFSDTSLQLVEHARASARNRPDPKTLQAEMSRMESSNREIIDRFDRIGIFDDELRKEMERFDKRVINAIKAVVRGIKQYDATDHRIGVRIDNLGEILTARVMTVQKAVLPRAQQKAAQVEKDASSIRERTAKVLPEADRVRIQSSNSMEQVEEMRHDMVSTIEKVGIVLAFAVFGVICATVFGAIVMRLVIINRIVVLMEAMVTIAAGEGDLTSRLRVDGKDELGSTARAFNQFVARIHEIVTAVQKALLNLTDTANQLNDIGGKNANEAERLLQLTNLIDQAMQHLNGATDNAVNQSDDTVNAAHRVSMHALQGKRLVKQSLDEIGRLVSTANGAAEAVERVADESEKITSLLGTIRAIASQTNLLALNAAIESARAGEHGRGFAVVADEVRQLSVKTDAATSEVNDILDSLQLQIRGAVSAMRETENQTDTTRTAVDGLGEALEEIMAQIRSIEGANEAVAAAIQEQSTITDAVDSNVTDIRRVVRAIESGVKRSTDATGSIREMTEHQTNLVGSFKV